MTMSDETHPHSTNKQTDKRPESAKPRLKRKQRRVPEDSPPAAGPQPRVVRDADGDASRRLTEKELQAMSDESLMEELNRGNHGAFATASERWRPYLEDTAWRYLRRAVDVHDAVQQTFLKIYLSHLPRCPNCSAAAGKTGSRSDYRFRGNVRAWICTILRNVIFDMFRQHIYIGDADIEDYDLPKDGSDVDRSVLIGQVRQKCEELKPAERELILGRMDGKTVEQLAKEKNCAISTMSDRLNEGIRHLRQALGVDKK